MKHIARSFERWQVSLTKLQMNVKVQRSINICCIVVATRFYDDPTILHSAWFKFTIFHATIIIYNKKLGLFVIGHHPQSIKDQFDVMFNESITYLWLQVWIIAIQHQTFKSIWLGVLFINLFHLTVAFANMRKVIYSSQALSIR